MARGTREQYVRPPVVAREAPSSALARWRFRAVAAVLMALVAIAVVLLFLRFSDLTAEDPGLGIGMRAPVSGPSAP